MNACMNKEAVCAAHMKHNSEGIKEKLASEPLHGETMVSDTNRPPLPNQDTETDLRRNPSGHVPLIRNNRRKKYNSGKMDKGEERGKLVNKKVLLAVLPAWSVYRPLVGIPPNIENWRVIWRVITLHW